MASIKDKIAKAVIPRVRRILNYGQEMFSGTGYGRHGASESTEPLGTWYAFSASPRDDIDKNLYVLRKRSRDLYMSSSLLSAILNTKRDGVVGRGLKLDAKIDAEVLGLTDEEAEFYEGRIEREFLRWALSAGEDGESFDEIVSAAYMATILSGDCLININLDAATRRLRLQVIEGDCLQTPFDRQNDERIQCGVEMSRRGRPIAYWCATNYEFNSDGFPVRFYRRRRFMAGFQDSTTGQWIPPINGALHVHAPYERPGQLRGIPACARVLSDMKQLDRYTKAELDAAVVSAKPTVFIEHPAIDAASDIDAMDESGSPAAGGPPMPLPPVALGNGVCVDLENGAKANGFNPTRPNTAFPAFTQAIISQISAGLGVSPEIALKSFNSSYSASRAALLDADRSFSIDRALLVRQLIRPIYAAWLDLFAADLGLAGYYSDPRIRSAWRRSEWIGEQLPSIDPLKEAQAAQMRVSMCTSTLARESQIATGTDIQANIRQRGFEEAQMRKHGLVKDQNGVPVSNGIEEVEE